MTKFFTGTLLIFLFSFTIKDEPNCIELTLYQKASFPVGVAVNTEKLKDYQNYRRIVVTQFNSISPEKIMKPEHIHPKKDFFYFTETDRLIDFCKYTDKRLHGHTLVWHKSLPIWIENFTGNKNEWESLLKNHIQTIINHCKGFIKSWDVVNEAFNDDGSLRKNIWLKNIGETYIEKAFIFAREADSTALLFYNDHSLESDGHKLRAVLNYFTDLKSKGVKVDGIGMQMHISINYPSISQINGATMHIQEAGFMVHYSELDIKLNRKEQFFASRKHLLQQQKDKMKLLVEGYMKLNPKNRFGITLWGVSDNDSWLTEEHYTTRPLLYDFNYKVKPAYCGFIEGLND